MAYGAEVIPADRAAALADRFLAEFGTVGVRFYTNTTFYDTSGPKLTWSGAGWASVTSTTFDSGVLVVGLAALAACGSKTRTDAPPTQRRDALRRFRSRPHFPNTCIPRLVAAWRRASSSDARGNF